MFWPGICCGDVAAVDGLLPGFETRLNPLLELFALRTLAVSDIRDCAGCGESELGVVNIRGMGGCVGSSGYARGTTSQWARKCSPRTEL